MSSTPSGKVCPTCGEKDISKFGKNNARADRLMLKCKKCTNAEGQKRREEETLEQREERLAYHATYNASHREQLNAAAKRRYQNDPERAKAEVSAWQASHPELVRFYTSQRRAREKGTLQPGEQVSMRLIYQRDHGLCYICGKPVDRRETSIDHVVALESGGQNTVENMRLAHQKCNKEKRTKALVASPEV